jgi:hypothetical protein
MRAVLIATLWAASGALMMAKADPLPDPPPQVLPDPTPRESHDFPPAQATSGIGDPGRELAGVQATNPHDQGCTTLNPCAAPPPSLQRAEAVPSRAPAALHPD